MSLIISEPSRVADRKLRENEEKSVGTDLTADAVEVKRYCGNPQIPQAVVRWTRLQCTKLRIFSGLDGFHYSLIEVVVFIHVRAAAGRKWI
jgi:hypothetical protein